MADTKKQDLYEEDEMGRKGGASDMSDEEIEDFEPWEETPQEDKKPL